MIRYTYTMQEASFWQGFWRLADPKISLASLAGMFMAACFAATDGELHGGWLTLVVLGILCVEVAKNASGEIVDFGSGIPTAVEEQLFEPFFTGSAQGTGLGLYISRELCEGNQARLDYISGNGGARFRITFHRHTDTPPNR